MHQAAAMWVKKNMKEQNVAIFQKMPAISDRKVYECSKFQFL